MKRNNRVRAAVITNGAFPVPAVKGGGVEGLLEELLAVNEKNNRADLVLFSIADEAAEEKALVYPHSSFRFIHSHPVCTAIDRFLHFFAYDVFHSSRHLAFKTTFQRLSYLNRCAKILRDDDFDVVVFENQLGSLLALRRYGNLQKYRGRYMFHIHNHPEKYLNLELLKEAEKVLAVSRFIGEAFARNIGYTYKEGQLAIVPNMVDRDLFDPDKITDKQIADVRRKLGTERKIILFVGRLIPGKGIKELLEAYENMHREDTAVVIVGGFNANFKERSSYEDELEKMVRRIGEDRVIMTGYIPHAELPSYYAAADLVVLPSTCEEAAGLTMMESLAMHRPLITTTMGGIPEYVGDGAVMVENDAGLVSRLEKEMERLLDHPEVCAELTEKAEKVSADWSLQKFYDAFIDAITL